MHLRWISCWMNDVFIVDRTKAPFAVLLVFLIITWLCISENQSGSREKSHTCIQQIHYTRIQQLATYSAVGWNNPLVAEGAGIPTSCWCYSGDSLSLPPLFAWPPLPLLPSSFSWCTGTPGSASAPWHLALAWAQMWGKLLAAEALLNTPSSTGQFWPAGCMLPPPVLDGSWLKHSLYRFLRNQWPYLLACFWLISVVA